MSAPTPKHEEKANPWAIYEQRKAQLPDDLTSDDYREACKRIAEELGI